MRRLIWLITVCVALISASESKASHFEGHFYVQGLGPGTTTTFPSFFVTYPALPFDPYVFFEQEHGDPWTPFPYYYFTSVLAYNDYGSSTQSDCVTNYQPTGGGPGYCYYNGSGGLLITVSQAHPDYYVVADGDFGSIIFSDSLVPPSPNHQRGQCCWSGSRAWATLLIVGRTRPRYRLPELKTRAARISADISRRPPCQCEVKHLSRAI